MAKSSKQLKLLQNPEVYRQEMSDLVEFITEEAKNSTTRLNIYQLCKEFKQRSGSRVSLNSMCSRIRNHRQKTIHNRKIDTLVRARIAFTLCATVTENLLKEFQKIATIQLNENQQITKIETGSLKLNCLEYFQRGRPVSSKAKDEESSDDEEEEIPETPITKGGKKSKAKIQESDSEEELTPSSSPTPSTVDTVNLSEPKHYPKPPPPKITSENSLCQFLKRLQQPVVSLGLPVLDHTNIQETIRKLEIEDKKIPIRVIRASLEACLPLLTIKTETGFTNLSEFLNQIVTFFNYIKNPMIPETLKKFEKLSAERKFQKIPIENIRYAMEATLGVVSRWASENRIF